MIKEIIVYETTDGSRFSDKSEAEEYDALCKRCDKIMSRLKPHMKFGAVRQDILLVKEAFASFMDLLSDSIPEFKWMFNEVKNGDRHPSHAEKVVNDYGIKCLSRAFFRFNCTNMTSGIEYEQPYFVEHEERWDGEIK